MPPNTLKFVRKLVKSKSCCKRVDYSSLCDLFLVKIVGQSVKMPPPPMESVSAHHWLNLPYTETYAET